MSLPPEIRNEVYKHTAKIKPQYIGNDLFKVKTPGLFCCSRQSRQEGLIFFYKYYSFCFHLGTRRNERCLRDVRVWLYRLDRVPRKNIRTITIEGLVHTGEAFHMKYIHRNISDEATVTYHSFEPRENIGHLAKIRARFFSETSEKSSKLIRGKTSYSPRDRRSRKSRGNVLTLVEMSLVFLPGRQQSGQGP